MKFDLLDYDKKLEFEVSKGKVIRFRPRDILVKPGQRVSLRDQFDPAFTGGFNEKSDALERVSRNVERMAELQEIFYAQDTYAILIIFQAMDAA